MCGIAGIINGGNAQLLARMSDTIAHRGPDDAELQWFADSSSGLAHRRLSIIDLSPAGHQPMCSETGDLWIVFNGEIYNYQELREELAARGCASGRIATLKPCFTLISIGARSACTG